MFVTVIMTGHHVLINSVCYDLSCISICEANNWPNSSCYNIDDLAADTLDCTSGDASCPDGENSVCCVTYEPPPPETNE